jgi:hypothetical protein
MPTKAVDSPMDAPFDLGHRGDVDLTQIRKSLTMTPTERLRRHEEWRLFVKQAVERAKLRRTNDRGVDRRSG